jgi:hypothetical protein
MTARENGKYLARSRDTFKGRTGTKECQGVIVDTFPEEIGKVF